MPNVPASAPKCAPRRQEWRIPRGSVEIRVISKAERRGNAGQIWFSCFFAVFGAFKCQMFPLRRLNVPPAGVCRKTGGNCGCFYEKNKEKCLTIFVLEFLVVLSASEAKCGAIEAPNVPRPGSAEQTAKCRSFSYAKTSTGRPQNFRRPFLATLTASKSKCCSASGPKCGPARPSQASQASQALFGKCLAEAIGRSAFPGLPGPFLESLPPPSLLWPQGGRESTQRQP